MGRPRKNNPLNLPPRVYFKHGSFFYQHRDGRWENLGTDLAKAKARGDHLNDPKSTFGTISWYLDEFITWCESRVKNKKLSPRTLADYQDNLTALKAYCGHMTPAELGPHHVQKYLDLGVDMDRSVRANREKACLSACFTWIRTRRPEANVITNPCFGVRRNTETARDVYVETTHLQAVYRLASPMAIAYAELVYRTLQRPDDVLGWTRANIAKRTKSDGAEYRVLKFEQSKTGAKLEIEIDAHLASVLDKIKRDVVGIPLIHSTNSKRRNKKKDNAQFWRYTEEGIGSMWRRWVKRAGVPPFGVMDLRGKGATDMYLAGISLEKIQALMGHESVTTTEIYVKRRMNIVATPNQVQA